MPPPRLYCGRDTLAIKMAANHRFKSTFLPTGSDLAYTCWMEFVRDSLSARSSDIDWNAPCMTATENLPPTLMLCDASRPWVHPIQRITQPANRLLPAM